MGFETPDILKRVDRTPNFAAKINAVSGMPTSAAGTPSSSKLTPRFGETFASVLNRSTAAKTAETPATINDKKLVGRGDENEMQPGETAIGYLNRRHAVTVNDHRMTAAQTAKVEKAVVAGAGNGAAGKVGSTQRAGESDAAFLNRKKDTDPVADKHAQAEKAAEGLVSNALILPVLKQLRRSMESENNVFSGGNGEKAFGPEFDMQLADRIARSPRLAVKNALVDRLEHRPSPVNQNGPKPSATRIDVNG